MSLARAKRLLRGEPLDKMPFFLGGLDHPAHTTQVTGIDAYAHPGEAYLEFCRRMDIDFIGGVPGSSDQFAPGEVKTVGDDKVTEWGIGGTTWHTPTRFTGPEDVLAFKPLEEEIVTVYGASRHLLEPQQMIDEFGEGYHRAQQRIGDIGMTFAGTGTTLFQYGIALFGWEPFLETAGLYPEAYGHLLEQFAQVSLQVTTAWAQTDVELFWSHDDIAMTRGTVFHPDWYREYIIPRYREIWQPLKQRGIKVIFVSDGDYTPLVDDIMAAGADGCFSEPLVDINLLVTRHGADKILFSGADTRILTNGSRDDVANDVATKMAIGRRAKRLCFMAAGGTPQNCPIENVATLYDTFQSLRELG